MTFRGKGFIMTFLSSLNPLAYRNLVEKPIRNAILFYLAMVLLSFIILGILLLPNLWSFDKYMDKQLSKFDVLKIRPTIATKEPVELKTLGIIIDTKANESAPLKENVLITERQLVRKPLGCMVLEPACLLYPKEKRAIATNFSQMEDVLANKKSFSEFLKPLVIILFPTFLLIFFIIFAIKYFFFVLLLSIIVFIILGSVKKKLSFKNVFNAALYLSPILILPTVINFKFNYNLYYIPLIIYVLAYIIIILFVGEGKAPVERE